MKLQNDTPSPTPIARIPVEILYEILKVSLYGGTPSLLERIDTHSLRWMPGRLFSYGQVCRLWRSVVVSSPDLWSTISISDEHLFFGRRILPGVIVWLQRSNPLPIDVLVHINTTESEVAMDLIEEILDLFRPHAHRFRKLSLHLPSREMLRHASTSFLSDAPLLEDLDLCLPSSESSWRKPQLFNLPFAPRLKALHCIGWKAFYSPNATFHNLREIHFAHYIPHSLAWEMLVSAPNLEVIQMGLENDRRFDTETVNIFPHLRRLDLKARDSLEDDLNPLFDVLSVPNLEDLSLTISPLGNFSALAPGSADRLLKVLKASSFPHVARLLLHNVGLIASEVVEVFNVLSRVTSLDLSGVSLNSDILALLSAHPPQCVARPCLPLLKSLTMDVRGRSETDVTELLDVICRRRSAWSSTGDLLVGADLETVVLINCPRRVKSALEEDGKIEHLRASGLELSFR